MSDLSHAAAGLELAVGSRVSWSVDFWLKELLTALRDEDLLPEELEAYLDEGWQGATEQTDTPDTLPARISFNYEDNPNEE